MAAVVGDFVGDSSRFHGIITSSHQHSHEPYRPRSRSREPSEQRSPSSSRYRRRSTNPTSWHAPGEQPSATGGASRLPSPPSSSSSASQSKENVASQDEQQKQPSMESEAGPSPSRATATTTSTTSTITTITAKTPVPSTPTAKSQPPATIPSPASDQASPASPARSLTDYGSNGRPSRGHTIHVRDLAHVQSLARADMLSGNGSSLAHDPPIQQAVKYEISGMPIGDIIEMVAALLTKITTTNDMRHDANHRNAAHQQHAASHNDGTSPQMSPLSTSVLAFHGKNVPAITILSYLSRIHKYCPTTYEVFLSLLVYFDRMTERVNAMVVKSEQERLAQAMEQQRQQMVQEPKPPGAGDEDVSMEDESDDLDSDLADDDDAVDRTSTGKAPAPAAQPAPPGETRVAPVTQPMVSTYFVVDSYNIHRLIIAGVTCASKFFSDVFYTNSRYAKVGGLPLGELNHLELQFLLLNDFRLSVIVEDLEAYATMLVEFYAREVVGQRSRPSGASSSSME